MKKSLFIVLFSIAFISAYAQSNVLTNPEKTTDTIYFYRGPSSMPHIYAPNYRVYKKANDSLYHITDYYMDGKLYMVGDFKSLSPLIKNGKFLYFSSRGELIIECTYENNKLSGEYKFYRNNRLWAVENYVKGKQEGRATGYFPNGSVRREETYADGKMVSGKCYTLTHADTAYYPKEEAAEFPGGTAGLSNFLQKNIRYPQHDQEMNTQGTVYVSFLITAQGSVTDVHITRGLSASTDNEVYRVVKAMPTWKPGKVEGENADTRYNLPVSFKLSD